MAAGKKRGIIVQKYGGSSVADVGMLKRVAAKIVETRQQGYGVVVVISAMGNQTDELLALAKRVSSRPSSRELDMLLSVGERIAMAILSMAINDLNYRAISFTGSQSGIITDSSHTRARIVEVRAQRIIEELEREKIVIVAGYQGVSREREITTLGRGGSDTTAIALAAALSAERCEIYSDVDGVYTADPRIVDGAIRIEHLSYDDMEELSRSGAVVMKSEAVEYARKNHIRISLMSSFRGKGGTKVGDRRSDNGRPVLGLSYETDLLILWGNDETWANHVRSDVMPGLADLGLTPCCIHRLAYGPDREDHLFVVFHNEGILDPGSTMETVESEHPSLAGHVRLCGSVTVIAQDAGSSGPAFGTAINALKREKYDIMGYYLMDRKCTFYLSPDTVRSALKFLHGELVEV